MSGPTSDLSGILDRSEIVRAGAGAGKTTELTKRVIEFAKEFRKKHGRLPKLVVTTFTRKATEELRERLLKIATENQDAEIIEYVSSGRSLVISTIHGVLTRFLRQYGHLLGLDANFSVVNERAADQRDMKIVRDILTAERKFHELLDHFSIRELVKALSLSIDAVMYNGRPRPVAVEELCQIRKARLDDWLSKFVRVIESAQSDCQNSSASKQTSAWLSTLQSYAKLAKGEAVNEILEIKKPNFSAKNAPFRAELNDELKSLLKNLEKLLKPANEPAMLEQFARLSNVFAEMRTRYLTELDRSIQISGQLEMRDIERYSLAAIETSPELARVFGAEWDYWLIDEFQDTSPLQVRILREFISQAPAYYVGDPQQSIYLFRGSRREVFEAKEREIEKNGGLISLLNKNYRSNPSLLLFFNDVFSVLSPDFMRMEPRESPQGSPRVATFYRVTSGDQDPYAPIVQHLQHEIRAGERLDAFCILARRHSELLDIARTLERYGIATHVHSGARFFSRREILDLLSIVKFLLNPHDNENVIRILRSPWFHVDDSEMARIVSLGRSGARDPSNGGRDSSHWRAFDRELGKCEPIIALRRYRDVVKTIGVFETLRLIIMERKIVDHSHAHDSTGVKEANIWKFLSLLKAAERTPGFQYLQFINDALSERDDLSGGEESMDAVAAIEPNRVNLMTIHKSKGLKFKHVILPNLHASPKLSKSRGHEIPFVMDEKSGAFSIALKCHDPAEDKLKTTHCLFAVEVLDEFSQRERDELDRLLYVAMTRAEETVILHSLEPESGSWAQKLEKLFSPGKHAGETYAYEVLCQWPSPEVMRISSERFQTIRPLFEVLPNKNKIVETRWSVTELVNAHAAPIASVSPRDAILSAERLKHHLERPAWGQKIHEYFEKLKYGLDKDPQKYFEKWFGANATNFLRAAEFTLNLTKPPIRQLIDCGQVEWGFQLKTNIGIVEGQIDLWGVIDDVAWLVDYKSGSAAHVESAFRQLDFYTLALRAIGVKSEIYCAVVYALDESVVVRPARARDAIENELSQVLTPSQF